MSFPPDFCQHTPPAQIILQIFCGYTVEMRQPFFEAAHIAVDVLNMQNLFVYMFALAGDDQLIFQSLTFRKSNERRIAIRAEQHIIFPDYPDVSASFMLA